MIYNVNNQAQCWFIFKMWCLTLTLPWLRKSIQISDQTSHSIIRKVCTVHTVWLKHDLLWSIIIIIIILFLKQNCSCLLLYCSNNLPLVNPRTAVGWSLQPLWFMCSTWCLWNFPLTFHAAPGWRLCEWTYPLMHSFFSLQGQTKCVLGQPFSRTDMKHLAKEKPQLLKGVLHGCY